MSERQPPSATPPPGGTGLPPSRALGRESMPRLADFTEDLLWPRLLRAVPLAMRPERMLIAIVMLALTFLIGELSGVVGRGSEHNFAGFVYRHVVGAVDGVATGIVELDAGRARDELRSFVTVSVPRAWERYGVGVLIMGLPILLVWAVGGCAIARMTACDFSQGVLVSAGRGLAFALARAGALLVACLGPVLFAGFFALLIAIMGWALLGWGAISLLGAVLYGPLLVLGALAVVLLFCTAAGTPMLVPAVAVEGSDGFDAVQRSFAYVVGRPLQLLLYGVIALLLGWGTLILFDLLADAVVGFTAWSASIFGSDRVSDILNDSPFLDGRDARAHRLIEGWELVPAAVVGAYAASYFFSASTVLYLLMRQAHDGQDHSDIWMPGAREGAITEALKARASAAMGGTAATSPDPGPNSPGDG